MIEPSPFALISGASSGIGLELAKQLAHRGYDLVMTAEDAELSALLPGPTGTEFVRRAGMGYTIIGSGPKDNPAQVAEQGNDALLAGKAPALGGWLRRRVTGAVSAVTPDGFGAVRPRLMAKPGSALRHG